MNTSSTSMTESNHTPSAAAVVLRTIWHALRVPLLVLLTLLEPLVCSMLSLAMLLGIVAAVAFELSAAGPNFPFLAMLALSLAFGVALSMYYGILALLSR